MSEEKEIKIDQDLCIGCGGCEGVAPEYFKINSEGKSDLIKKYDSKDSKIVQEAIDACPVGAISFGEEEE